MRVTGRHCRVTLPRESAGRLPCDCCTGALHCIKCSLVCLLLLELSGRPLWSAQVLLVGDHSLQC